MPQQNQIKFWTIHTSIFYNLTCCFAPSKSVLDAISSCNEFINWIANNNNIGLAIDDKKKILKIYKKLKNRNEIKGTSAYVNFMTNIVLTDGRKDEFPFQIPSQKMQILKNINIKSTNDILFFGVAINSDDKLLAHSINKTLNQNNALLGINMYYVPNKTWKKV